MKCKVDPDGKAAAEEKEEEEEGEEEAGEKIRGKRREKPAWGRRGRTLERCRQAGRGRSGTFPLDGVEDEEQRVDGGGSSARRGEGERGMKP